ncbi:MAG: CPBP family intramembrane metalloprotease, partial [Myxococcales bacterium]|nr:CPBP family intramembrane metalloprotease [Myxococcales bacterium]
MADGHTPRSAGRSSARADATAGRWPRVRLPIMIGFAIGGGLLAFILSVVVATVVAAVVARAHGAPLQADGKFLLTLPGIAASLITTAAVLIGAAAIAARLSRTRVGPALGLRGAPWLAFLAAGVGIVALGPTADLFVQGATTLFPNDTHGTLAVLDGIGRRYPFWMLWPLLCLLPGMGEEIFFRGMVQRAIGRGAVAIWVSALAFATFHLDPRQIAGVLPLAFFLAWTAARTGSTSVTIFAHVLNNTVALATLQLYPEAAQHEPVPWPALVVSWAFVAGAVWLVARASPRVARAPAR